MDEMRIFIVYMNILSPSNLLKSPSFDDRMMEINLRRKIKWQEEGGHFVWSAEKRQHMHFTKH